MARHSDYLIILVLLFISRVSGTTFTFVNKCDHTVWPGILDSAGSPKLNSTGFELPEKTSRTFQAPASWSGRFWARTGCHSDSPAGLFACATADCGSGTVECNGAGAAPPATLAEFTLNGAGGNDFYDVSLVDGYNLPMIVEAGPGGCASTGCVVDLNRRCPAELRADGGGACKSACGAFRTDEYCCSGAFGSPALCKPSVYSEVFKSACPKAYSYAFDDATSTFTCSGADYVITFCPSLPGLKSSRDSAPAVEETEPATGGGSSGQGVVEGASFASSWLADLATGDSLRTHCRPLASETTLLLLFLVGSSFLSSLRF